jgi:hypothetical protein
MTVGELFDNVRKELNDDEANHFEDALLLVPFNRLRHRIAMLLTRIGSDLNREGHLITGNGTSTDWTLPDDFGAFLMDGVLFRNPYTATSKYTLEPVIPQIEPMDSRIVWQQTLVAVPNAFCIYPSGQDMLMHFDTILPSGYYVQTYYWKKSTDVTISTVNSTTMPFHGHFDTSFHHALAQWCYQHLEANAPEQNAWLQAAVQDAVMLMGLRQLHHRELSPSIWEGFPW